MGKKTKKTKKSDKKKPDKWVQMNLVEAFGLDPSLLPPEVERPRKEVMTIPLPFGGGNIRVVMKAGEPWFVLADVARALEYRDAANASRLLAEDEKGTHLVSTLGGHQDLGVVNESGLYRLVMRSKKAEAEKFRLWVFREVLPSIRKTGRYETTRAEKYRHKLNCDEATAVERVENCGVNKAINAVLAAMGAKPNDFKNVHNGFHIGRTSKKATEIREAIGAKKRSPIPDHMSFIVLSGDSITKACFLERAKNGDLTIEEAHEVAESLSRDFAEYALSKIGGNCAIGIKSHPDRGLILDVVPAALMDDRN